MATTTDTKALRTMKEGVAKMRQEVDASIASMLDVRDRLDAMAHGIDLAVKAEDERRGEGK